MPRVSHSHSSRPSRAWGRLTHANNAQRGSVTIEAILLIPFIFGVILAIVEGALYFHAQDAARMAASQALEMARAEDGTDAAAVSAADQMLAQVSALVDHDINISRTADEVTVTVSGDTRSLVPFITPEVSQSATGPIEQWSTP